MGFVTHARGAALAAGVSLTVLCGCFAGHAQSTSRSTSPGTSAPDGTGRVNPGLGLPSDDLESEPQSLRVMRLNARRDDIKKRMEQNASRLLLLSAELRNELQHREPTEADAKRLDEIAKLAHAVREQMKQ